jgi:phosphoribosyl-dephospho-CoA transferase
LALKEITEKLKRAEQTPINSVPQESVVSSYEVDAMLHSKQHEIREIASQLDIARVDAATATLQLESAVKQRDHWRAKYDIDMEELHARHVKERDVAVTIEKTEMDGFRRENARLLKELNAQQHEVVKLKNDLAAEVARTQLLQQEAQRAPSESVSFLKLTLGGIKLTPKGIATGNSTARSAKLKGKKAANTAGRHFHVKTGIGYCFTSNGGKIHS